MRHDNSQKFHKSSHEHHPPYYTCGSFKTLTAEMECSNEAIHDVFSRCRRAKIITSHRLNFQHPFMLLCTIFIFLHYFFTFCFNGNNYLAHGRSRVSRSYLPSPILFPAELAKQSMTCSAGAIGQNHHFTPSKFSTSIYASVYYFYIFKLFFHLFFQR